MDLAQAITIIIPRPFAHAMGNRGMARMAAAITLPFIGVEQGAAWGHVLGHERVTGLPIRMVTNPQALLARVARDDADNRGTIVGRGAVAFALIGASAWRVVRMAMGRAFFPPRSGTVRRPQTPCRSSPRLARYGSGSSARAGATYAVEFIPIKL